MTMPPRSLRCRQGVMTTNSPEPDECCVIRKGRPIAPLSTSALPESIDRVTAVIFGDGELAPGLAGGFDQFDAFGDGQRDRLLAQHIDARAKALSATSTWVSGVVVMMMPSR